MSNSLPTRPNLDHLREQAKDLLSEYRAGNAVALSQFSEHLPAANGLSPAEIAQKGFALSDAQSIVARKLGFVSWPKLVKHIETLRSIEGTWNFTSLEVEGSRFPEGAYKNSTLIIDGDQFKMISPEANYEGKCAINADTAPYTIDIHFTEGPEAGNSSFGIWEFDGRELKICLGLTGFARPTAFVTTPGSGHALETLRRGQVQEIEGLEGELDCVPCEPEDIESFREVTPELEKIQGEWNPLSIVKDGMALPSQFIVDGKRVLVGTETTVSFGGKTFMQALTRVDANQNPVAVDYLLTEGASQGKIQAGIMEWDGDLLRVCFAEPGGKRPVAFDAPFGSGFTLTVWRRSN